MVMKMDMDKVEMMALRNCWCLTDVAKHAGIAAVTLYRIKDGSNRATSKTIGKVAKAFGVDPMEILVSE